LAINDNGQVVGYSTTADGVERAFLWENGSMRALGVSSGWSRAQAITNAGKISGLTTGHITPQAFVWDKGVTTLLGSAVDNGVIVIGMTASRVLTSTDDWEHAPRSAVWQDGAWQRVEGVGYGGFAVARGMNGLGQIVGAAPVDETAGDKIFHPFVWENGVMRDLGVLSDYPCGNNPNKKCGDGWAVDLNSNGDIVGYSSGLSQQGHAVLWPRAGAIRDLGLGRAVAINETGEVAGDADWAGTGNGFFWRQGSVTTLPSLGGNRTFVVDLNDLSMVLGSSLTAEGKPHVFVWTPGRTALLDLGAGPSADQAGAVAINARGDIIGSTCDKNAVWLCAWPEDGSRAILWRAK
jgi:probable HAF family extracellular repeat protein